MLKDDNEHGLYYVDRDNRVIYRLDTHSNPVDQIPEHEMYVLKGLLDLALDRVAQRDLSKEH